MLPQKMTILDHCWVCLNKFNHSLKREDHHVIPRAYGGLDGPQVSLCDSHHTAAHLIANKMWSKRSHFNLLTGDDEQDKKLLYLAMCIHNARVLTSNDPNKRQVIVLSPTREFVAKLDKLKHTLGGRVSREKLIMAAVEQMYARTFIK